VSLLALNASPSSSSKTHAVAAAAVELAGEGHVVDLGDLDAEGLLGRRRDDSVASLLEEMATVDRLVLVTPVYRATYSGLLKVVFDQLAQGALGGTACVLAATAAGPIHFLSLDTGLRSLVASVEGWSVPTVVYAVPSDFDSEGKPLQPVLERLSSALGEASQIARGRPAP
jgi:FMN reductase